MTPKTLILASSRLLLVCLALILLPANSDGQESDTGDANGIDAKLRRIFTDEEFEPEEFGPARWQDDGAYYTTLEPSDTVKDSKDEEAKDIVRYETTTGLREVVIEAGQLVPEGRSRALEIDDYAWSEDKKRLLVFTNTERVWRRNTRGDYWVMDLATGDSRQLGGDAAPSTLMFAKFSPDGTQVAYVQGNNLYVEEIDGGSIIPLTSDGSETIINGTSDWVYEEELGIRDGFRWSPDGRHIAFWNFDSSGVDEFALINNTDTLYPEITLIPYPKAGTTNSAARIGVVGATGGEIRWMDVPGDSRNTYIARMDWCDDSETLILQHLNRLQNTNDVLLADAATGEVRRAHQDRSDTWVDVMDDLEWLEGSEEFVWLSEKDGWRHAYRVRRDGGGEKLITPFEADVISLVGTGSGAEWLYFIASPDNATQRFLYRAKVDGSGRPERVTPTDQPGSHSYDLSPDGAYAFHTYSRFDVPPVVDLVRLPEHETVRVLEDNAALASKLSDIVQPPVEFFQTEVEPGLSLDSWMLEAARLRAQPELSTARLRLRRAGGNHRGRSLGRRANAVSSGPGRRGLRGRQLRQPRHAGTQGGGLEKGRLRNRRRTLIERPGGRCPRVQREAFLCRSRAGRRLGVEWRGLEHPELHVPLPGGVQGRCLGGPGSRPEALRHHLPGALHGPTR